MVTFYSINKNYLPLSNCTQSFNSYFPHHGKWSVGMINVAYSLQMPHEILFDFLNQWIPSLKFTGCGFAICSTV